MPYRDQTNVDELYVFCNDNPCLHLFSNVGERLRSAFDCPPTVLNQLKIYSSVILCFTKNGILDNCPDFGGTFRFFGHTYIESSNVLRNSKKWNCPALQRMYRSNTNTVESPNNRHNGDWTFVRDREMSASRRLRTKVD